MKFSLILALLPLALAAPNAAPAKKPCCTDCQGKLFQACREGCWDSGAFSYCSYQCVGAL
ncbi:hypothetical protein CCMA1212_008206 [Trichoderma ghanense]|uniref:SSCRP protein n=1 Tax=Trichoderma ghanense TaxID=65468 RepID=A0ABY2GV10_9HYPO